jgi:hypothetical protein
MGLPPGLIGLSQTGHAVPAQRATGQAQAWPGSCFGPAQVRDLSCRVVLMLGQIMQAAGQPIYHGPNFPDCMGVMWRGNAALCTDLQTVTDR